MADTLVDSDILIDIARNVPTAITYLQGLEMQGNVSISTVTQMELLIGCRNKTDQRSLERFLQRFALIKFNELIADTAVDLIRQYRLSHGLLLADAVIAATAISLNLPLATKNQRDYRFITGLQLLNYP